MSASGHPRVALCLTVLDEAGSLGDLFASVAVQTRPLDEIVVVDGGSTDGTVAVIQDWQRRGLPITLLVRPGAGISAGRNLAIAEARAPIVAVTDGGVRLDPGWLAAITAPFASAEPPDVVAGFFQSDPRSAFETALGATTLPAVAEVDPTRFYPSSRSVAFTRRAWEAVGGYPEWLDYCEDLLFDFALADAGFRMAWAPDAIVHFRPRPSPRAFYRQYYRYARGDGKADLWRTRHAIRYATYLGLPFGLLLGLPLGLTLLQRWPRVVGPLVLGPLLLAMAGYLRRPYMRLWPSLGGLSLHERAVALAWVPSIRLIGDVAKMAGYPVGRLWRVRHRAAIPPNHPRR